MAILHIYFRVLGVLRDEKRLAFSLVGANLALAIAQFAEPVLFGRIIDTLTRSANDPSAVSWAQLSPLVWAWIGFGIFTIGAAVLVALHADRLSHRRRMAVMSEFFEHVLHLPLGFHTGVHSGRLLKTMLDGSGGMASVWLSFFREHCASFVSLFVLLPATLFLNWRLAALLMALVVIFGAITAYVFHHTEALQGRVETYNTDLAERASDALGNIAIIQSFTRVEAEAVSMRRISDALLKAQLPVLSWWAIATVATRASRTDRTRLPHCSSCRHRFSTSSTVSDVVGSRRRRASWASAADRSVRSVRVKSRMRVTYPLAFSTAAWRYRASRFCGSAWEPALEVTASLS